MEAAHIDSQDYLPRINGAGFHELQASGGGMLTAVHVAYSLALLTTAVDDPNVSLPSLLIIDSPQKAIGQNPDDIALSQRIYGRFLSLAETYGPRIQLILADNELPDPSAHSNWNAIFTIGLRYQDRAMIPGVWHPGPSAATIRVEQQEPDSS